MNQCIRNQLSVSVSVQISIITMSSDFFSFMPFDFNGIQGDFGTVVGDNVSKHQEPPFKFSQFEQQGKEFNFFEDHNHIMKSPSKNNRTKAKEAQFPIAMSSLELLSNYASTFKKMKPMQQSEETDNSGQKLSTEDIMRVAGARYINFSTQSFDDVMNMDPISFGCQLSSLSEEENRDVELVHLLLAAAEKVGYQQHERASRLLSGCELFAAERGNSLQRVVYYFAEALRKRIDYELGRPGTEEVDALVDHGLSYNVSSLKCYQKLPFNQVLYYTAVQSVNENVANSSKIHVIDFEIRSGVQWTTFMLALAERDKRRPVQLLKITAVGLQHQESVLHEVGKRLSSFAEPLKIPFTFTIVCVKCYLDIKLELFRTRHDESLVVYCPMILRLMLCWSRTLENLLSVIKRLNPSIMVVCEIEANHNSPSFVNRFTESLFFYGAYFDSLECCLEEDVETRTEIEGIMNKGIRNLVAVEGCDRIARSVKIDVWRAFFTRFGMVEIGFSDSCLQQANLVLNRFPSARFCNLEMNGKSLIMGWKGTPIHSLSVWKFPRERRRLFLNYRFEK